MSSISQRKTDHLDLTLQANVGFRQTTTLFECVRLVHDALPDLDFETLDTSVEILGKRLNAPILIAGMTGGNDRAGTINRQLAEIAQAHGYALGLGSQRAMVARPETLASYRVREVAPSVLLLGNLGIVQAREMSDAQITDLVAAVGADALCVHMNPAMELVQDNGDRDFRGGLERFAALVESLPIPVVAKETGCGISADVAIRLRRVGVRHIDVSGAGGTSWVGVEALRASAGRRGLGESFWDWGVPTAASVVFAEAAGYETIFATGGLRDGLDVARALALGASAGGIARQVLKALDAGGPTEAAAYLQRVQAEIRTAMLLTGSPNVAALRRAPRVVVGELRDWISQVGPGVR